MNEDAPPAREGQKPKLLDGVRSAVRTRHYSIRTEEAYVQWIGLFILLKALAHYPRSSHKGHLSGGKKMGLLYKELSLSVLAE